jgi:hypothetical protein
MIKELFQTAVRGFIAIMALATIAFGAGSAVTVNAGGLRNCVDITGPNTGRVGCYEYVWADGVERRMVFSNQGFDGATPKALDVFYVLAPQTATPQGPTPGFPHDHVVRDVPAKNHGTYTTKLQGFFVLCSGSGVTSGVCAPQWITPPGAPGVLPFVGTVNGQPLTSVAAVDAAANAGHVVLINLGPSAVIVGSISGK